MKNAIVISLLVLILAVFMGVNGQGWDYQGIQQLPACQKEGIYCAYSNPNCGWITFSNTLNPDEPGSEVELTFTVYNFLDDSGHRIDIYASVDTGVGRNPLYYLPENHQWSAIDEIDPDGAPQTNEVLVIPKGEAAAACAARNVSPCTILYNLNVTGADVYSLELINNLECGVSSSSGSGVNVGLAVGLSCGLFVALVLFLYVVMVSEKRRKFIALFGGLKGKGRGKSVGAGAGGVGGDDDPDEALREKLLVESKIDSRFGGIIPGSKGSAAGAAGAADQDGLELQEEVTSTNI